MLSKVFFFHGGRLVDIEKIIHKVIDLEKSKNYYPVSEDFDALRRSYAKLGPRVDGNFCLTYASGSGHVYMIGGHDEYSSTVTFGFHDDEAETVYVL